MAKITPEIKKFLDALEIIGERTEKYSKEFGEVCNPMPENPSEIRRAKEQYLKLLKEYESQEEFVMKLESPVLLRPEHSRLNQSYNKFVIGTDAAIRSMDTQQNRVNEGLLKEGQISQQEAAEEIVKITNDIIRKLR